MKSAQNFPEQTRQTGVRKVRIDDELAGQRIDNFLRRELPGLPKGRLYRILRRGEVRVNGGRVRAEYKLRAGDEVRVPPARISIAAATPPETLAAKLAERFPSDIWLPPRHEFLQHLWKPDPLGITCGHAYNSLFSISARSALRR